MEVTAAQLAELFGVDDRTVTNWVNEDPPCPSRKKGRARVFEAGAVIEWYAERRVRQTTARLQRQPAPEEADARRRKLIAEMRLAEINLLEKEGELVPAELHEEVCGQLADRLRAVCVNAPSTYALDLERAGVPGSQAQELLERIAEDLTRALRGAADPELEEEEETRNLEEVPT